MILLPLIVKKSIEFNLTKADIVEVCWALHDYVFCCELIEVKTWLEDATAQDIIDHLEAIR